MASLRGRALLPVGNRAISYHQHPHCLSTETLTNSRTLTWLAKRQILVHVAMRNGSSRESYDQPEVIRAPPVSRSFLLQRVY